jgi:hypothetical protein
MKNKILISYSHLDYEIYVKPIEEAFKRAQIDFWIDKSDIESGTDWDQRINLGLNQCSVFLAIVTPNYRKSPYCFYEVKSAATRYKDDPKNRTLLAVYTGPRLDSEIDDFFSSPQSHFFDINKKNEEISKLLDVSAVKKCSLFINLEKIDETEYKYIGNLLGKLRYNTPINEKILLFYKALITWYQSLFENKQFKINTCESFDLYQHRLNSSDIRVVLSDSIKFEDDIISDQDIIKNTKKMIKELFFNDLEHPYLSLNDILNNQYQTYNDLLNDYKKLYNLSLYIENNSDYVINEKIIQYALDQFILRENIELGDKQSHLLTNISANNQTYIDYPTLSLLKDQNIKNLFLYGESGCGKTVSMLDLVSQIRQHYPVLYLPLDLLSKPNSLIKNHIIENNTEGYNLDFVKLRGFAKSEKVYLIIDGTNEAHENAKEAIVAEIANFANDFSLIITSRTQDIILNKSLLQDKEFPNFTYGKYHLLTDEQVKKHLEENQISFNYTRNKMLFNILKNNLRLKMFTELKKGRKGHDLDLTTPGELLFAYFFDDSSNSILSKLKQDYYRNLGRGADGGESIDNLFKDISSYAINNRDFKDILKEDKQTKLLSSLGIFEINEKSFDFTHSDYRHFFEALYLNSLLDNLFKNLDRNFKENLTNLKKYLLLPHITYETLYFTANLAKVHKGNKYLFENLFKLIKDNLYLYDKDLINKLYVLVALGLNDQFETLNTYGLLEEIPSFMFDGCNVLNAINIPEGVKTISRSAFYRCENLSEIVFPETLTNIRSWAFVRCPEIKSVSIPVNVNKLGCPVFVNCEKLMHVTVDNKNRSFSHSLDQHLLLDKKQKVLLYVANGAKEIELPKSVTTIGPWAFKDAKSLTKVFIPSNVNYVSSDAFDNCHGLLGFEVDPKNKYFTSIDGLLVKKEKTKFSLTRVPAGIKDNLLIPKGVTNILNDSISTSIFINEIFISKDVTIIGDYAFADCINLTNITFENLGVVQEFGKYIFLNCHPHLRIYDQMKDQYYTISEFERKFMIQSEKPQKVYQGQIKLDWHKIFAKDIIFDVVVKNDKSPLKAVSIQRDNKSQETINVPKIIIFGLTEYEKISVLSFAKRQEKIKSWIENEQVVAVLITRDLPIYSDLLALAKEYSCDLLSFSNASTTRVSRELERYFRKMKG